MNKKTRIRVGVVLIKDEQVLVIRMHRENADDIYVLPGGGLEGDEGIIDSAIREVKEETNLDAEIVKILYLKDLYSEKDRALEIIFLGRIKNGELKKGFDPEYKAKNVIKSVKFVDIKDFEILNFHPKQLKECLHTDFLNKFQNDTKYLGCFKYPE